ncbi:MAG TPA: cytochrome P450 [Acidimicrobiales bacterium]|nr:cytochrome P450 [Acidimicrobiales bacterium]
MSAPPRFGSPVPNFLGLLGDILGLFQRVAAEGHDVTELALLPGVRVFFVNRPDLIREVLDTRRDQFRKPKGLGDVRPAVGDNLQTLEGAEHRRHRLIAEPAMAPPSVARYAGEVADQGARLRDEWRDGVIDLHGQMLELMFRISGRALFASPVETEAPDVQEALDAVLARAQRYNLPIGPLLDRLPLPSTTRMRRGRERVDSYIDQMTRRARDSGDPTSSLLAMMLAHDGEGGAPLTDAEARDEAVFMFLAAWETVADALTWTFYELARNPAEQDRLHAEVDGVLGGERPTAESVERMPYLGTVVKESLRLYAIGWGMLRQAAGNQELGGYTIPAKSYVLVSPFVTQRDGRWYPDPTTFSPDRWTRQDLAAAPYFPFSLGFRTCLGEHFASMALPLLVATLSQRWSFHPAAEKPVQPVPQFALRPKGGLPLRVASH